MQTKVLFNKWSLLIFFGITCHALVTVNSQFSTFEPPKRQSADTLGAFASAKIDQTYEKGKSVSLLFGIKPTELVAGNVQQERQEQLLVDLSPVLVAVSESNGHFRAKLKLTLDGKDLWQNVVVGQQLYGYDIKNLSLHSIEISRQEHHVVLPLFVSVKAGITN